MRQSRWQPAPRRPAGPLVPCHLPRAEDRRLPHPDRLGVHHTTLRWPSRMWCATRRLRPDRLRTARAEKWANVLEMDSMTDEKATPSPVPSARRRPSSLPSAPRWHPNANVVVVVVVLRSFAVGHFFVLVVVAAIAFLVTAFVTDIGALITIEVVLPATALDATAAPRVLAVIESGRPDGRARSLPPNNRRIHISLCA